MPRGVHTLKVPGKIGEALHLVYIFRAMMSLICLV